MTPAPAAAETAAVSPAQRRARVWLAWMLGAAFLAALLWTTLAQSGAECEVCVAYRGETACRTVAAADSDDGHPAGDRERLRDPLPGRHPGARVPADASALASLRRALSRGRRLRAACFRSGARV